MNTMKGLVGRFAHGSIPLCGGAMAVIYGARQGGDFEHQTQKEKDGDEARITVSSEEAIATPGRSATVTDGERMPTGERNDGEHVFKELMRETEGEGGPMVAAQHVKAPRLDHDGDGAPERGDWGGGCV